MEPIPPLRSDPEFRPAASERALPPVVDPGAYRRVLFNPFLGLLGAVLWASVARAILIASVEVGPRAALLLIPMAAAAYHLPRLFQYHCLDCGGTGRLSRWKRHVCPSVARRILEGRPRRRRGPGPMAQMLIWGYVLAAVLLLLSASGLTSR